jgi:5-formyltetrahydrofolate cyclo-ligase
MASLRAGAATLGPSPEAACVTPRLLLVPLAASTACRRAARLRQGYYDRALARLADLARLAACGPLTAIGIAFACQEVPQVPTAPHDRRLDAIVTERETILPLLPAD